eukprot:jgi/Chlat1/7380/Chrsp6S07415
MASFGSMEKLRGVAAGPLRRLLQLLPDAVLAVPFLRAMCVYILAPQCRVVLRRQTVPPAKNKATFDNIPYCVSPKVQEVLLHAAQHALDWRLETHDLYTAELPALGRILLCAPDSNSNNSVQEAVATALANHVNATLVIVDSRTLGRVAATALEGAGFGLQSNVEDIEAFRNNGLVSYVLSFFLYGGLQAFVMDIVRAFCTELPGAVVLFFRDVENTLCCSPERFAGFVSAFGEVHTNPSMALGYGADQEPPPMVLIGASSLGDTGAELVGTKQRSSTMLEPAEGPAAALSADSDGVALSPSSPDVAVTIEKSSLENPRAMLAELFTTRVQLDPPREGLAQAEWKQRMQQDAALVRAERCWSQLQNLAVARHVKLPPFSADLFDAQDCQLSCEDWTKALAWAISLRLHRSLSERPRRNSLQSIGWPAVPSLPPIPRSSPEYPPTAHTIQYISTPSPPVSFSKVGLLAPAPVTASIAPHMSTVSLGGELQLTEEDLLYGLDMLRKASSRLRPTIQTDNPYERQLLNEVLHPEDAGAGFCEVGALSKAKQVLQEAVQLPLEHPELFAKGTLARSSKGVLLFGPPGTGKTLLARAVAAECGASFITLQMSTIASKWLGDGVRYVRSAFSLASKLAPTVIFVDEVDALLGRRDSHSEHEALREIKNEFMSQWDGIRSGQALERVIVLGATNRPYDLDDAVLRRFSRRVFCELPDKAGRTEILKVLLAEETLAKDFDLDTIVARTDHYSGSDLKNLCYAAALRPLREHVATSKAERQLQPRVLKGKQLFTQLDVRRRKLSLRPMTNDDFTEALQEVLPTISDDSHAMQELRRWNARFGDGTAQQRTDLSYFM